jgi:hypothetical protein
MSLSRHTRPSPAMIVAALALVLAMAGTAIAGPSAVDKITKSKVKSIAKKQADKRLKANVPGSHVNVADQATTADKLNGFASSQIAPIVTGQRDVGDLGVNVANGGQTETNSVSINAPAPGVLMINGSVFLRNGGPAAFYDFIPRVDGAAIGDGTKATIQLAASGVIGDNNTFAYTAVVPVGAGAHTVSQTGGPQTGTTNFFYNRNNLSVVFSPQGSGVTTNSATKGRPNG